LKVHAYPCGRAYSVLGGSVLAHPVRQTIILRAAIRYVAPRRIITDCCATYGSRALGTRTGRVPVPGTSNWKCSAVCETTFTLCRYLCAKYGDEEEDIAKWCHCKCCEVMYCGDGKPWINEHKYDKLNA
jgi:hypothetical protein